MPQAASKTTTRELRANLRETLAHAAKGKEIVVTLRGKPYVRIVPVAGDDTPGRYPLRGSVRFIADDFDAPMPDMRDAPQKKPSRSKGKRKQS
jgi:prevent-host-death family protein